LYGSDYNREICDFNNFIEKVELVDISMVSEKLILYKPNETIKSRIDRALVSRNGWKSG